MLEKTLQSTLYRKNIEDSSHMFQNLTGQVNGGTYLTCHFMAASPPNDMTRPHAAMLAPALESYGWKMHSELTRIDSVESTRIGLKIENNSVLNKFWACSHTMIDLVYRPFKVQENIKDYYAYLY